MNTSPKQLSLTYSLADQSFARTKSVGILNVSVSLLPALARRPECANLTVLSNTTLHETIALPTGTKVEFHDGAVSGPLGRIWWDQSGVYTAAKRAGHEWLLLPKGFASFARRCPVRLAVFIHDMMQNHYDRHHPADGSALEKIYFRAALRAALRQAEIVFTPTEFTRHEIERVAGEHRWRLPRLVCCGEGFERPASAPSSERRDLVVLTSHAPHKLTRLAVDYLTRWWQRTTDFREQVHWIGSFPAKLDLPDVSGWRRYSRLPEPEFRTLMSRARAVLFFSEYEGFGRPPVEAVLAGACPVYSDIPATHEVMEGRGSPFLNADYESFASALDNALKTSPDRLRVWGDEILARYDWSRIVERMIPALQADRE